MSQNQPHFYRGRFAVAPMLDWTTRHCRYFHRQFSRHALLYTEMVTTQAIIHAKYDHLDFDAAEQHRAMDCIECGSCSFICPSRRLLLPSIRQAKREIGAKRRKAAAAQKK